MEGTPIEFDINYFIKKLKKIKNVISFHQLNVWSLNFDKHCISIHVVISKGSSKQIALKRIF